MAVNVRQYPTFHATFHLLFLLESQGCFLKFNILRTFKWKQYYLIFILSDFSYLKIRDINTDNISHSFRCFFCSPLAQIHVSHFHLHVLARNRLINNKYQIGFWYKKVKKNYSDITKTLKTKWYPKILSLTLPITELWFSVDWYADTNVPEASTAFVFRTEQHTTSQNTVFLTIICFTISIMYLSHSI